MALQHRFLVQHDVGFLLLEWREELLLPRVEALEKPEETAVRSDTTVL